MINEKLPIYLASKSPRRRKLLKQINLKFKSFSVDVPETFSEKEKPVQIVTRLSKKKMNSAKNKIKNGVIITADTIVVLEKKVIGKPINKKDAFKMLKRLSGKTHTVFTGYCIFNSSNKKEIINYVKTKVTFRKLNNEEIWEYIESGSPMDKAGAYGIQDDFGAVFIDKINGCYYNVVGLPLSKFYHDLLRIY